MSRYECWTPTELDRRLQRIALDLHKRGLLPAKLKHGRVPRYRITLFALQRLAQDGNDETQPLEGSKPAASEQHVEEERNGSAGLGGVENEEGAP